MESLLYLSNLESSIFFFPKFLNHIFHGGMDHKLIQGVKSMAIKLLFAHYLGMIVKEFYSCPSFEFVNVRVSLYPDMFE